MQGLKYRTIENTVHDYSILGGFEHGTCISKAYVDNDSFVLNSIVIEQVNSMLLMAYAVYSDGSIHGLVLCHTIFIKSEQAILRKLQNAINAEFDLTYAFEAVEVDSLIAKIIA